MKKKKPKPTPRKRHIQASDAVLGSILLHAACMAEVDLVPEDFGFEWQRVMFQTILEMSLAKEEIDTVTVAERLQKKHPASDFDTPQDTSWLVLCSSLTTETPTWRNVASYAKLVRESAIARKAATIGMSLAETVTNDVGELDTAIRELMSLTRTDKRYSMRIGEAIANAIDALDDRVAGKTRAGIPSGFKKLDELLGGLCPGHLIVVGARPGMGKTTFGLDVLLNNPKIPSGFISTEMPTPQLVERSIATISGVSAHAMRRGKVADADWPRITEAVTQISEMPIYINEQPAPNYEQVMRQARQWKYEHNIQLLVIDYIQRIKSRNSKVDRREELQESVVAFKETARELNIPVVLLAQINRSVEARADKRPTLADFKDTGALEEEGDAVITLYRDEVYNPKLTEHKGLVEICILKHRHGPTGWFRAKYNAACLRIENLDESNNF